MPGYTLNDFPAALHFSLFKPTIIPITPGHFSYAQMTVSIFVLLLLGVQSIAMIYKSLKDLLLTVICIFRYHQNRGQY